MYDEFYKLTGRPFQLTPDHRFYFESATHRKALSYLGYGLAQGEGFIVITGEVGAGKSTLAAHLMATVDRARLTAAQIVTSALDGEELIHVAARSFGLDVAGHDKATALAQIEAFLHEEARAGRRCLLVVDESQNLTVAALEELRMLSNFQLGAHPLLQILLLGQPEFRALLQGSPDLEQLRQRVIASHHLDAMEVREVGPYIEHRLACVGWQGTPSFDPQVYADLARATGGVPRRVNQIINRLLMLGAMEQAEHIDAAMLADVLADLAGDSAFGTPVQAAAPVAVPSFAHEPVVEAAPVSAAPVADVAALEAALALRDDQIAELQQAVVELAAMHHQLAAPVVQQTDEALLAALSDAHQRIAALEQLAATVAAEEAEAEETLVAALTEAQDRIAALEQFAAAPEVAASDETLVAALSEAQQRIAALEQLAAAAEVEESDEALVAALADAHRRIEALEQYAAAPMAHVTDDTLLDALAEAQQRIEALELQVADVAPHEGDQQLLLAISEANRRIAALEGRTYEQEQAIRHTLTMLIEWIESEDTHRAAA